MIIGEGQSHIIEITSSSRVVEIVTSGPQGPVAPPFNLGDLPNVKVAGAVNKSLLYYDAAADQWKGDATHTTITLTDGGGF